MDIERIDESREISIEALQEIAESFEAGMTYSEAKELAQEILESYDVITNWHPLKIRFGKETQKSFRDPVDESVSLKEGDIFFLDIGPVINSFEADYGDTFVVGENKLYEDKIEVLKDIFESVKEEWIDNNITGEQMYALASKLAAEHGLVLSDKTNGHRVSDFPMKKAERGSLKEYTQCPEPYEWILELHLIDPELEIGLFFEDLLM